MKNDPAAIACLTSIITKFELLVEQVPLHIGFDLSWVEETM